MFLTVEKEFKLFNKDIEYEQTPYQKNLAKIKQRQAYRDVAVKTMNLIGYKDFDKSFDGNLKYELLNEINSADNLNWQIKKCSALKKTNLLKNIAELIL